MFIIKMSNMKNWKDLLDVLILVFGVVDGVLDGDLLISNEGDVCICFNNFILLVVDVIVLDIFFGIVFGVGVVVFGVEEVVFDVIEVVFEVEGVFFDVEVVVLDFGVVFFDIEVNVVVDVGIVLEVGVDVIRGVGSVDILEFEDNDFEVVDGNGEDDCDDECVIVNVGIWVVGVGDGVDEECCVGGVIVVIVDGGDCCVL